MINNQTNNKGKKMITMAQGVFLFCGIIVMAVTLCFTQIESHPQSSKLHASGTVAYRTLTIDGVRLFYREAGDPRKPTILLLHGFPSSSHMFRDLIPLLGDEFHVIAPDYPGFGQSDSPSPSTFTYSFDNIAIMVERLISELEIERLYLYVHDYGGPIGFRIATKNPSLVKGLIIQNANAYEEGWGTAAAGLRQYIEDPSESNANNIAMFLTLAGTKFQYFSGAADTLKISPDTYSLDQYYLDKQGNNKIQYTLFRDYKTNIALYDEWQRYFKREQPRALILWGKNDPIFTAKGATAYKKHLPESELHLMDGGHFLVVEQPDEVARRIKSFVHQDRIR